MSNAAARRRWGLGPGLGLGISLGGARDAAGWRRQFDWVERSESLGLHSVWVPEMHFAPTARASPLLALAAFAARTAHLRLGTTSLLLPIHDPVRLAEEVAALDRNSGGRVLLGLGRGFRPALFRAFGIDAAEKRPRFDAALEQMRITWAGPLRRPSQLPHPPLAVAAFGPKGLRQAARLGLPYLASPVEPVARIAANLSHHRENLPSDVSPDSLIVPVMRTVHVTHSPSEASRIRTALDQEARLMARRVPAALARALAADSEDRAIVGTRNQCIDRLGVLRETLGIDLLIARPELEAASQEEREASIEALAGEVLPAIS